MTKQNAKQLKETLTNEFGSIFSLCQFVIDNSIQQPDSIKGSLIRQCLKTL